jgi:hypothetical protein
MNNTNWNKRIFQSLLLVVFCGVMPLSADVLGNTLKAFEDKPGYVQPIATILGTVNNSGWHQSAGVGKEMGWSFSIPINLAYIHENDWHYTRKHNECGVPSECGSDITELELPTIFGPNTNQTLRTYYPGLSGGVTETFEDVEDGDVNVRKWSTIPMVHFQGSFMYNYTEFKLRLLPVPAGPFNFFILGFGIQHDIRSFMEGALGGPMPLDVSFTTNLSWWNLSYATPDPYEGDLELNGLNTFTGFVLGKRAGAFEFFTEIGWETANLNAAGNITNTDPDDGESTLIQPDISVDGRNGFKISANVAVHLGTYSASLGQHYASQYGSTINVLSYRKEGFNNEQ